MATRKIQRSEEQWKKLEPRELQRLTQNLTKMTLRIESIQSNQISPKEAVDSSQTGQ